MISKIVFYVGLIIFSLGCLARLVSLQLPAGEMIVVGTGIMVAGVGSRIVANK